MNSGLSAGFSVLPGPRPHGSTPQAHLCRPEELVFPGTAPGLFSNGEMICMEAICQSRMTGCTSQSGDLRVIIRTFAIEERLLAINKELEIARRIQPSILAQSVPALAGLKNRCTYMPMSAVAGPSASSQRSYARSQRLKPRSLRPVRRAFRHRRSSFRGFGNGPPALLRCGPPSTAARLTHRTGYPPLDLILFWQTQRIA
jgi:hypothetical protein